MFAKLDLLPTALKIVQIKNRLYENLWHFFLSLSRSIAIITLLILSHKESGKPGKGGEDLFPLVSELISSDCHYLVYSFSFAANNATETSFLSKSTSIDRQVPCSIRIRCEFVSGMEGNGEVEKVQSQSDRHK